MIEVDNSSNHLKNGLLSEDGETSMIVNLPPTYSSYRKGQLRASWKVSFIKGHCLSDSHMNLMLFCARVLIREQFVVMLHWWPAAICQNDILSKWVIAYLQVTIPSASSNKILVILQIVFYDQIRKMASAYLATIYFFYYWVGFKNCKFSV